MKKNIAIIMGGYSSEYLISLKSGSVVHESLPAELYNSYCIHIFKDKWVYVNKDLKEFSLDKSRRSRRRRNDAGLFRIIITSSYRM